MGLLLVAIVFVLLIWTADSQSPPQLTSSYCSSLNGVMNGARCFYYVAAEVNWSGAWTECAVTGGTLAQIHTKNELDAVLSMVASQGISDIWVALKRDSYADGTTDCDVMLNASFWYDGATSKDARLVARDTWIRYRVCHDLDTGTGSACYSHTVVNSTFATLVDRPCESSKVGMKPLCQFNTAIQCYVKTEYCMQEKVFESLPGVTDLQQCADLCAHRVWCRSFNFLCTGSSGTCDFFSMSALDPCPECASVIPAAPGCAHYNYVA